MDYPTTGKTDLELQPFSKIEFLKLGVFKWLTDFNFIAPKQISINQQMERIYETSRLEITPFME